MSSEEQEQPPEKKRKKKRNWKRIALEVGVFIAIIVAVRAWQKRDAISGAAPELRGVDARDATPLVLAAAPGEPVLVHFWATWCGVCRAEEGTIDGLAEDHNVITIATQSGQPADLRAYLDEHELDFPVISDPTGSIAQAWGVHAFPTSFVVGADGSVRSVEVGYTTSLGLRARLFFARL